MPYSEKVLVATAILLAVGVLSTLGFIYLADASGRLTEPKPPPPPSVQKEKKPSRYLSPWSRALPPRLRASKKKIKEAVADKKTEPISQVINELSARDTTGLMTSFSTTEIVQLSEQISPDQIRTIINDTSEDKIYQQVKTFTGISKKNIEAALKDTNENLSDFVAGLIEFAKRGEFSGGGDPISFGSTINPDNSPKTARDSFSRTDHTLYACFGNQGSLQGIKKVMVRWMNNSTGQLVFVGARAIDPNKPYNYIKVRNTKNWDKGTYQAQLFKINTSFEPLAQGTYQIK